MFCLTCIAADRLRRRLKSVVSPITRFMRAATYFSAPPCSKGLSAFWASSACAVSATSYHFESIAPPQQHRPPTPAGG